MIFNRRAVENISVQQEKKMFQVKVTIIGAGSTYTPEFVKGFIKHNDLLQISTLCLMNIDMRNVKNSMTS